MKAKFGLQNLCSDDVVGRRLLSGVFWLVRIIHQENSTHGPPKPGVSIYLAHIMYYYFVAMSTVSKIWYVKTNKHKQV